MSVTNHSNSAVAAAEAGWKWWAGDNDEKFALGPFMTRADAIAEATTQRIGEQLDDEGRPERCFFVIEARQDPLRLADWLDADALIERADENVGDSDRIHYDCDEPPYFDCSADQEADLIARIKAACDAWQADHNLVFVPNTFSAAKEAERVRIPADGAEADHG